MVVYHRGIWSESRKFRNGKDLSCTWELKRASSSVRFIPRRSRTWPSVSFLGNSVRARSHQEPPGFMDEAMNPMNRHCLELRLRTHHRSLGPAIGTSGDFHRILEDRRTEKFPYVHMGGSWNGGTLKSSISRWDFPWNKTSSYGVPPWRAGNHHLCFPLRSRAPVIYPSLFRKKMVTLSGECSFSPHAVSFASTKQQHRRHLQQKMRSERRYWTKTFALWQTTKGLALLHSTFCDGRK